MKSKRYVMYARGERYVLTPKGWIQRTDMSFRASPRWKVLGVSAHWASNYPNMLWSDMKKRLDKNEKIEGYLFDVDHGTTRKWGGSYMGKIPKAKLYKEVL